MEDDPKRRRPDISRALKYLQWRPKVNMKKNVKQIQVEFRAACFLLCSLSIGYKQPSGSRMCGELANEHIACDWMKYFSVKVLKIHETTNLFVYIFLGSLISVVKGLSEPILVDETEPGIMNEHDSPPHPHSPKEKSLEGKKLKRSDSKGKSF